MTGKAEDTLYPNYIKEHIKQRGYTIQEVANKVDIPRRTITDYVTGKRPVPRENLKKLARYLRCSVNELIAEPVHGSLYNEKLKSQKTSAASIKEEQIALPLELGSHDMDVLRREILQQVLGVTGATFVIPLHDTLNSVDTLSVQHLNIPMSNADIEEFLVQCAASITACWYLLHGSQLTVVDTVLATCLQKLTRLAQQPSKYQKSAAILASQGYLLRGLLAHHQMKFSLRKAYCQEAIQYGTIAEERNLQVAAMIQLGNTLYHTHELERALITFQKAYSYIDEVSPLLRSCIYMRVAMASSRFKPDDAISNMTMALKIFPEHPNSDPSILFAEYNISNLHLVEGLVYLNLGEHYPDNSYYQQSQKTFAHARKIFTTAAVSERNRIEVVNYQAKVAVAIGDQEQVYSYLTEGISGAKELGSQKRLQETVDVYRQARKLWPEEPRIRELADLFMM